MRRFRQPGIPAFGATAPPDLTALPLINGQRSTSEDQSSGGCAGSCLASAVRERQRVGASRSRRKTGRTDQAPDAPPAPELIVRLNWTLGTVAAAVPSERQTG